MAIGPEKLIDSKTGKGRMEAFAGGMDSLGPHESQAHYAAAGETAGKRPERTPFMDTYAKQACYHMKRYGTTREQIAIAAAPDSCSSCSES